MSSKHVGLCLCEVYCPFLHGFLCSHCQGLYVSLGFLGTGVFCVKAGDEVTILLAVLLYCCPALSNLIVAVVCSLTLLEVPLGWGELCLLVVFDEGMQVLTFILMQLCCNDPFLESACLLELLECRLLSHGALGPCEEPPYGTYALLGLLGLCCRSLLGLQWW